MRFVEKRISDIAPGSLAYVMWDDVAQKVTIPGWKQYVAEYAEPLRGVTAASLPDQLGRFREIGSRIRDPKGMLLSPEQRTGRAAGLFASALALAMIRKGWDLKVQPGFFVMSHGTQELNPFQAVEQMMKNKLSREAWVSQCEELGLSTLFLLPEESPAQQSLSLS